MDPLFKGRRRRLVGLERRSDDVDVYELTPPDKWRKGCGLLLDAVAEFCPQFRPLRAGVQLRFYSRAGFDFAESLARSNGAPLHVFTVKRAWGAFVHSEAPRTLWVNAQTGWAGLVGLLAHEARHIVQFAEGTAQATEDEATWAANEADAEQFAAEFVAHWESCEPKKGAA